MRLLGECRSNIDTVKRVGGELKEEEEEPSGLINLNSTETQTSGQLQYGTANTHEAEQSKKLISDQLELVTAHEAEQEIDNFTKNYVHCCMCV